MNTHMTHAVGRSTRSLALRSRNRVLAAVVPIGLIAVTACSDSTSPQSYGPATMVEYLQGANKIDSVGGTYVDTMSVYVVGTGEGQVLDTTVNWTASIGTLSSNSSTTSNGGWATVIWTFTIPPTAPAGTAVARLTATVGNLPPETDTVIAISGAPVLLKVVGDNQSGVVGTLLPTPLIVRITDQHGNPVTRRPLVTWSGTRGSLSGTMIPETMSDTLITTIASDETSQAYVKLGSTAGTDTVTATLSCTSSINPCSSSSVVFTETATP
jgi:hypothetical protein